MKKVYLGIITLVLVASIQSCSSVVTVGSSPGKSGSAPGQVKKTTGSQSAKPYAPGQKK